MAGESTKVKDIATKRSGLPEPDKKPLTAKNAQKFSIGSKNKEKEEKDEDVDMTNKAEETAADENTKKDAKSPGKSPAIGGGKIGVKRAAPAGGLSGSLKKKTST